ncbi:MAG: glycosyltransferase family 9 protein, partial [Deferribacteraceae bacterium]|nr:glycosyltransferase family 9 protein [Deferribacteraceae bacterium]
MKKKCDRILIIKIGALGDIALASSILPALKESSPDSHITWLCGDDLEQLVANFSEVDKIITVPRRFVSGTVFHKIVFCMIVWLKLSLSHYDLCIIAQQGKRYRILPIFISAKRFRFFLGRSGNIPGRYRGTDYARLAVGSDSEGDIPPTFPKINIPPAAPLTTRNILLFVGGAYYEEPFDGLRRYSAEKYRLIAERLLSAGYQVTLIGSKADRWVESHFEGLDVTSALGKTTINSLLAIIASSSALISHDSGPMHLAVLLQTPLVAIFGPTWHKDCLPRDGKFAAIYPELPCYPCYDGKYFAFACAKKRKKVGNTFEEP